MEINKGAEGRDKNNKGQKAGEAIELQPKYTETNSASNWPHLGDWAKKGLLHEMMPELSLELFWSMRERG